ncbi:ABC transporter permease [Thermobispora bispora]|jgi:D-methionine transport system permease protein|uniref:Binding-protein-dependent transport systems inner membrane component n=1 Tax=Thermobispora bispora (strain ATCC 19993 / DSM 43833 / CBS 139.67 / JCM 10125 / KCTC 9307 / NBRC 14880 / R51) TaxID=469371 RepID=D6YBQ9_THEBD|nr:methionine ABC transporter permease [Thermobispora bispora]MBO2475750.1 ABC transporter permease [Actinomycetales bacterium]MDI9579182.1 methionine ABC transporter permease [Thermobispora sp.]ADG88619.1 binding-protein-dependent transport systems inner membrane component [Thermobispora bispora DSM 43833]MBX6167168.1 ABC transporter permease [Thermobispora bispora]QSI48405.1 ABC transporter permease [Thermobispora bispora]
MTWSEMSPLLWEATGQTLQMVAWSTLFTALFGLPLGVLLVGTARGGLFPAPLLNQALGLIVNVGRSLPFVVLMIAVIPLTRLLTGTTIGTTAAVVPLTIGAVPFFARLVETSLREVSRDVVEAARAMGASRTTVVVKVLLPEALPGLVASLTVTVVALISYSAMAGVIGGGGLGDLAVRYGYQRFETTLMVVTVVVLVVLVQLVQGLGDTVSRRLSRR